MTGKSSTGVDDQFSAEPNIPTDRPLTAEDVAYVDGHLDLNHAPSLGTYIGKTLASFVSGNRMPEISGDNRKRIPEHIRRRYDADCNRIAADIIAYRLSRPPSVSADPVGGVTSDAGPAAEFWANVETGAGEGGASGPSAWLETNLLTGEVRASLNRRADSPTMIRRWHSEPLFLSATPSPPVQLSERERALEGALRELQDVFAHDGENSMERFERLAEMFRRDTGYLAPGKDPGMCSVQPEGEELRRIYDDWFSAKVTRARAALTRTTGEG